MIEKVMSRKNMREAYRQVVSNQGSAGVDGLPVQALSKHLNKNRDAIVLAVWTLFTERHLRGRNTQGQWEDATLRYPHRNRPLVTTSGQPSDESKV